MVGRARELLGVEMAALVGESYERAYGSMVRAEQLTELEEAVDYKLALSLSSGAVPTPTAPAGLGCHRLGPVSGLPGPMFVCRQWPCTAKEDSRISCCLRALIASVGKDMPGTGTDGQDWGRAGDEQVADARRRLTRDMWWGRLRGVQRNVEVWQALLSVRHLVLPAELDRSTTIKFASLCRKFGRIRWVGVADAPFPC